jgi:hypothetical protein
VTDAVGSDPQYDVFADEFLDHAGNNLYNAHYGRPTCLALLGDVAGRTEPRTDRRRLQCSTPRATNA